MEPMMQFVSHEFMVQTIGEQDLELRLRRKIEVELRQKIAELESVLLSLRPTIAPAGEVEQPPVSLPVEPSVEMPGELLNGHTEPAPRSARRKSA